MLVSDSFAVDAVTPEAWAEFLVKLVHGPELAQLTTYIAPLSEIRSVCGLGALGCYSRNRSLAVGEVLPDGTTPEEVVRHEYGHHIALYRSNSPWRAIDWGPKHWASSAGICAREARSEVFPGDEGDRYHLNPGEAWAETYRLMDERKAGITTGRLADRLGELLSERGRAPGRRARRSPALDGGKPGDVPSVRREEQDLVGTALDSARRLVHRHRAAASWRPARGRARSR